MTVDQLSRESFDIRANVVAPVDAPCNWPFLRLYYDTECGSVWFLCSDTKVKLLFFAENQVMPVFYEGILRNDPRWTLQIFFAKKMVWKKTVISFDHRLLIYLDWASFTQSANKSVSFWKVHTNRFYAASYKSAAHGGDKALIKVVDNLLKRDNKNWHQLSGLPFSKVLTQLAKELLSYFLNLLTHKEVREKVQMPTIKETS